jgi:hypothetical protein
MMPPPEDLTALKQIISGSPLTRRSAPCAQSPCENLMVETGHFSIASGMDSREE